MFFFNVYSPCGHHGLLPISVDCRDQPADTSTARATSKMGGPPQPDCDLAFMKPCGTSQTVLIAEDEALIGMALEAGLTEAGYVVAGVFSTWAGALEWLDSHRVDAAIIDCILRDGDCVELLRELQCRGVPILMHSGLNEVPPEFRELPSVTKPLGAFEVVSALDRLMLGEDSAFPQRPPGSSPRVHD
jgi:CheY-like chemotaxis protein